ncbi:MAG: cysteine desulfurase [Alphaproteobacteria bacterium]|nr:cysteine desulfurase [Alphaproteobacteria bacterium]
MTNDAPIYLDNNGTTPVAEEVLAAMLPYLRDEYGNASSTTDLGRRAKAAIDKAREQVAALIDADPADIVFTSGGTEASNHAIRGFAEIAPPSRRKIVTSAVEHPATENACKRLERRGYTAIRLPVSRDGLVDLSAAAREIDDSTALVTIIHAQNEIGTLEPVGEIAALAAKFSIPVHADASQSLGKVPVSVRRWKIDALTIAGHKLYAPKGIGALYLRRALNVPNLFDGAGQEQGRRPGTENVAYIAGLGEACAIAARRLAGDSKRLEALRERLWAHLSAAVPGLIRVAADAPTLPNTLNVLFPDAVGNDILARLTDVFASTGSACHAGDSKPSSIILALGYAPNVALGAVRLTSGRSTTQEHIDAAADKLAAAWKSLR